MPTDRESDQEPAGEVGELDLIRRVVIDDDHRAFEGLVQRHQSSLRQFLRRLTADSGRADDLAQETFFKAYRYLESFRRTGSFRSWLFAIGYQLFVTEERRRKRRPEAPLELEPEVEDAAGDRVVSRRTVSRMLAGLRPEERSAVLLCYQHDMTHREAAEVLRLPLGTVKSLVRRGREKMKQMYDQTTERTAERRDEAPESEGGRHG